MKLFDQLGFALHALIGAKVRTALMLLAMAIGVAAVVILTALGDGARRFVVSEFASMGSNLLIVMPGRSEGSGVNPSSFLGQSTRDLTVHDAMAMNQSRAVRRVAPLAIGSAEVSWRGLSREVPVLGSTIEFMHLRQLKLAQGKFLPQIDVDQGMAVAVLGHKLKRELFGSKRAVGEWVRIGDRRFRVIGVLTTKGRSVGMEMEDMVVVPVASAQMLFNTQGLPRVMVEARSRESMARAKIDVERIIKERHQGEEDITVLTQDAILATFDNVLRALTLTVAGIAAISLAVAGILIMNVMLVAVAQRTAEIGLLKALGASSPQIQRLFLVEASLLSMIGSLIGLLIGLAVAWGGRQAFPEIPFSPPWWAVVAALVVAVLSGLLFGVLPARRAARLDPVQALARGKN